MAILTNEELTDLKANINIVDIISQHVALTKNGKSYLGLCPFHGEKTPSFNVNAEKGFYHCFGCGKSGDAIEFLKEYKQIGFRDAVIELVDFAGLDLEIEASQQVQENPNQPILDLNNQSARLYNILLMSTELGEKARKYLEERGIGHDLIKRFNIGLAPDENDFIFKNVSNKFEEAVLANSGLFHFSNQNTFDAFSNRIMFPITNESGQTIGFSGRKWQKNDQSKAKYINTTATPVFDKSYELWNLDKAKPFISKNHEVYLMEGFMDVIAAYQSGMNNVVASMGTALTEKHVRRLKQLSNKFVLVYDGDSAGQNAINKAMNLIGDDVSIVKVPEGMDPDEYQKHYGTEELAHLMQDGRIQPIEFLIDFLKPSNLSNLQAQIDFIDQIAPMIAKVKSITAQDAFVRKLVEILPDFEYNQVESAVNLRRENVRSNQENETSFFEGMNELPSPSDQAYYDQAEPVNWEEKPQENAYQRPVFQKTEVQIRAKPTAVELVEAQFLHRMIYHPSILKRFAQDEEFKFIHQQFQKLFDVLMIESMSYDGLVEPNHLASELDEELRQYFYDVISLDLPDDVPTQEIDDLLKKMEKEQGESQLADLFNQLEVAKKAGNVERELELTVQIVNQKKKL